MLAETRALAIDRAAAALRDFPVLGIRTNIPFLLRILAQTAYRTGDLHTGFIDEHLDALVPGADVPPEALAAAADAGTPQKPGGSSGASHPWTTLSGWGR